MIRIFAAALSLFACSITTRADQTTITTIADNTLFSESADLSNGAGDYLFAGRINGDPVRRGLVKFDIAGAIPAGSVVTDVQLSLYMSRSKQTFDPVGVHLVLADWGEGASDATGEEGAGAPAEQDDATWQYRFYDAISPPSSPAWGSPGGDFDPTPSASVIVGDEGQYYDWTSAAMVSDVQGWLDDPGSNFGWMLVGDETTRRTAARFDAPPDPECARRWPDATSTAGNRAASLQRGAGSPIRHQTLHPIFARHRAALGPPICSR
ncbi:MAG: DNRLRE domain-containing protein [Phycisphaerales bacterium JB037]